MTRKRIPISQYIIVAYRKDCIGLLHPYDLYFCADLDEFDTHLTHIRHSNLYFGWRVYTWDIQRSYEKKS